MTRKRWLIALGALTAVLAITLLAIDPSTKDEGNPSIVSFEFAWDQQGAADILDDWGNEGQDAARLSLRLDFLYLLAYGAFFALACAATRDLAGERGWNRMAGFGNAAMAAAIGGALFDALEDVFLLISLDRHGGDLAPLLGSVFACGKFALLAVAQVYILAGLVLRFKHRRRAS